MLKFKRTRSICCFCLVVVAMYLSMHKVTSTGAEFSQNLHGHPQLEKGVLLVANRSIKDPNFSETVVLITEYNELITLGLILNRPTQHSASSMLPRLAKLSLDPGNIQFGGPVGLNFLQLLVGTEDRLDEQLKVIDHVYIIDSDDSLSLLLDAKMKLTGIRAYGGVSSWATGQLEDELLHGDWYLWRADKYRIFSQRPGEMWLDLIRLVSAQYAVNHQ